MSPAPLPLRASLSLSSFLAGSLAFLRVCSESRRYPGISRALAGFHCAGLLGLRTWHNPFSPAYFAEQSARRVRCLIDGAGFPLRSRTAPGALFDASLAATVGWLAFLSAALVPGRFFCFMSPQSQFLYQKKNDSSPGFTKSASVLS